MVIDPVFCSFENLHGEPPCVIGIWHLGLAQDKFIIYGYCFKFYWNCLGIKISRRIRVFLSYNHQHDGKYAKRIANDLRTYGYEVWLDIERLEAGTNIVNVLEKEIQLTLEQGALIVLASSHGLHSKWVSWEFSYALQLGSRVIPCIIDPKPDHMPFELQQIQWIDFTQSYEKGFGSLIKALIRE